MREKREWRTWLGRAPGRSLPVERRRPQRRAGGLQLFFFFLVVFFGQGKGKGHEPTRLSSASTAWARSAMEMLPPTGMWSKAFHAMRMLETPRSAIWGGGSVSPTTQQPVTCITHHDIFRLGEVSG